MLEVKCSHAEKGVCRADQVCSPILDHLKCPRLEQSLTRFFNPAKGIAILWDIDDVHDRREGLTDEEAMEVLEVIEENHDASYGVTWDSIAATAWDMFPLNPQTKEA